MSSHSDHPKSSEKHDHSHAGHSHGPGLSHAQAHVQGKGPQAIMRAIGITFIFMIVELIGGWYANSLALISDSAHMLTDIGAMLLSLVAIWIGRRPSTPRLSFGYQRAEILGALTSGLLIWVVSGYLIYESLVRMKSPPEVNGSIVFFVASFGLMANLVTMKMLSSSTHDNMNVRAAYLHVLSDSLGNVGAIIAGVVLWFTDWRPIDPIITIIFSAMMLLSSWSLVKEAISILMESTPNHLDPTEIQSDLAKLTSVTEVHDLHIWSVSSGKLALSVHLVSENSEDVLNLANRMLKEKYGVMHTTIQIEHPSRFESDRCYDCAVEITPKQ